MRTQHPAHVMVLVQATSEAKCLNFWRTLHASKPLYGAKGTGLLGAALASTAAERAGWGFVNHLAALIWN